MLAPLEAHLVAALAGLHPPAVAVVAGPWPGPESGEAIAIHAASLAVPYGDGEDRDATRGPTYTDAVHTFAADGTATRFALPDELEGAIAAVESPAGHPLRAGDDYVVEGRAIHLLDTPPAGRAVVAILAGERADGFVDRRPAEARVLVTAWAATAVRADAILDRSLGAVFPAVLDLGDIGGRRLAASPTTLRLHAPQAYLAGIARAVNAVGDRRFVTAAADVTVRGQLELAVTRTSTRPVRTIDQIGYRSRVIP